MKKNRRNVLAAVFAGALACTMFFTTAKTTLADTTASTESTSSASAATSTVTHTGSGTSYVTIGDTFLTQTVSAGQQVALTIPIVNYSFCPITNVVITPEVSNQVNAWPFELTTTGYSKNVPYISGYTYGADVNQTRADVTWYFTVRDDVKTGTYPLTFDLTYLENGETESSATITAYIETVGKAGSGYLEEATDSSTTSKPRIIVTGFETNPEKVHAGDTFTITIHVQNTSPTASVSNVLFNLTAAVETTSTATTTGSTYEAFLPTSGSSSIYRESIPAGGTTDLTLEMSARADLTQKPYVLDIDMTYDAEKNTDLTGTASVSVPIYQESRFDTGEESISPSEIGVGEQTNVSFSIYNTGKTTLYNVWVKAKSTEIEGEDVYIGTIASGATGYADAMYTGVAENDGTAVLEISYEDEAGNVTTADKEITLTVYEMAMDDYSYDYDTEGMDMTVDDSSQGVNKVLVAVIAVIVAAAVVVLVLFLRRRKKKAALKDEAELLDEDLLDDESADEKDPRS
jgi:hypothetical protein